MIASQTFAPRDPVGVVLERTASLATGLQRIATAAFDLLFDSPAVIDRVRQMQALLAEADACGATDPARAQALRRKAAELGAA